MTTFASSGTASATTAKQAKRTALVFLATITAVIGMTSAFAYSQAGRTNFAEEATQTSEAPNEAGDPIGAVEASRIIRCMMPPAWQVDCD